MKKAADREREERFITGGDDRKEQARIRHAGCDLPYLPYPTPNPLQTQQGGQTAINALGCIQ